MPTWGSALHHVLVPTEEQNSLVLTLVGLQGPTRYHLTQGTLEQMSEHLSLQNLQQPAKIEPDPVQAGSIRVQALPITI